MNNTEITKRRYHKVLELWEEYAGHAYAVFCEEQGTEATNAKEWKDIIHCIAGFKAEAFDRGIDGLDEPPVISRMAEYAEGEPVLGAEFWNVICEMIHSAYTTGQLSREEQ